MSTLSDRLQQAMDRRPGTSQADLARLTGAKSPSVSNWFGGRTKTLSVEHSHKLAEFFGCDPQWLAIGSGAPGWSDVPTVVAASSPTPTDLSAALPVVLDALCGLPAARAVSVRAQLDQVMGHPEMRDDVLAELEALLQSLPGKRHG